MCVYLCVCGGACVLVAAEAKWGIRSSEVGHTGVCIDARSSGRSGSAFSCGAT